jgi:hypothetical protein
MGLLVVGLGRRLDVAGVKGRESLFEDGEKSRFEVILLLDAGSCQSSVSKEGGTDILFFNSFKAV